MTAFIHHLPFGAERQPDGTARFRIWAPSVRSLRLLVEGEQPVEMRAGQGGWFEAERRVAAGARYRFELPDGLKVPDPASRLQASDVHDPSVLLDPSAYAWKNAAWRGRPWNEAVVYELHPGAMGGFNGIREKLPALKSLGVTAIELMPINDFPGKHNWGYDGVLPFAPDTAYGTPDELKALIDAAHGMDMMVMQDVVYNHFGPDGAYIHVFAKEFFREDLKTPWGAAIDFRRREVRDYFLQNALYWLMEYRFDGLRFDAVHAISEPDFLDEMARTIRATVEPGRHVHLVLEHGGNKASHLRAGPDAPGYDAQWSDDWHHCVHVLLTGEHEGYYADFKDATRLLARCLAEGFAYQGEESEFDKVRRGEPSAHLPPTAFVVCLQNHDQTGNRAFGERPSQLADPQALRAATALLLLAPNIPMLFMGEEWGTKKPFLFFTDHNAELAKLVREGRREEFKHFSAFKDEKKRESIPDPNDRRTFEASIPDEADSAMHEYYTQLLRLRFQHVVPGIPGCRSAGAEVLGEGAVLARWTLGDGGTLAIAVNLGAQEVRVPALEGEMFFATGTQDIASGTLPPRSLVALA